MDPQKRLEELNRRIAELEGGSSGASTPPPPPSTDNFTASRLAEVDARIKELEGAKIDPVVQEMHPSFSDRDRFVVQNFANNNEAKVNYLQKQHPDLEIKVDNKSNQILARKRDGSEPAYKVLDPSGFQGAGELWRDVKDVASDVVVGGGSAIGTAIGAGLGAGAGSAAGGVGAAPGAIAGGAAGGGWTAATLEALKQAIGKEKYGIGDYSGSDIALSGLTSAVSAPLFGTGASAAKLAKAGLQDTAYVVGGLPAKAWDAVKPKLGEAAAKVGGFLSGLGDETLKVLGNKEKAEIAKSLYKNPEGALQFLDDTATSVQNKFDQKLNEKWSAITNKLGAAGDEPIVDVAPVVDAFKNKIDQAEKLASRGTKASKELVSELKSAFDRHFINEETGREILSLSPNEAIGVTRELSNLAGYNKTKPNQLMGDQFSAANLTQAEKELMALGAKLKGVLDDKIDEAVPGIKADRRAWGELRDLEKSVEKIAQNPRMAFSNLKNAGVDSNLTNRQLFNKVDRLVGTDLADRAKIAAAAELTGPGRKSFFAGGLKDRVPSAALGAGAGALLGGNQGGVEGGLSGAAFGTGAGLALGGPAAMRAYIAGGRGAAALERGLQTLKVPQTAAYPWLRMQLEENRK